MSDFDVVVVGGGINGAGIARDLAGRGWRVLLAERDDLASHTSSSSTKLIHGGLRYLEHREFALVRKALQERERLLRSAPHIMRPLRFVMPHDEAMRPAWLIRLGLFLYDHLARRDFLPASCGLKLRGDARGAALKPCYNRGFVYSDGWVDDARLVVLNALDAQARGARILTRSPVLSAQRTADHWRVTLGGRAACELRTRVLVNAAGPWAESFLRERAQPMRAETLAKRQLRLVKGSHIVIRRQLGTDHAYIFQNADGRIIFAIPYEGEFTLIGTTDVELPPTQLGQGERLDISDGEVDYLCAQASRYLATPVHRDEVVWGYAGVRPLLDDEHGNPAAVTRDYQLDVDQQGAPLLSVWGGKITTFRKLAEDAADRIGEMLGDPRPRWTETAMLPGGDFSAWIGPPSDPVRDVERLLQALRQSHPWLPEALARRWLHAYGSRIEHVLADAQGLVDLGQELAPNLYASELRYLADAEWACTAEDVLWRRSKLGLHLTGEQQQAVAAFMREYVPKPCA